jgi:hypothetical protein
MFGVTGAGMNKIKNMASGGKRHRWSVDQWDKVGRAMGNGDAGATANSSTAKYDRLPLPEFHARSLAQ